MSAVIAQCSEYTYLKSGKRIDGSMFSCTSMGIKLGGGIGIALSGWLLDISGYINMDNEMCIRDRLIWVKLRSMPGSLFAIPC